MVKERPTWDEFYLGLAQYVGVNRSKDPSTKVGAVIVRPDHTLCSIGYNGFPQHMNDSLEHYVNREEKYSRIVHGEINALIFSREPVKGYTLYTWPFIPCDRCFVQMAQAGIVRVVAPVATDEQLDRWGTAFARVRKYAQEMNIELVEVNMSHE